jgi:hypothetical protein
LREPSHAISRASVRPVAAKNSFYLLDVTMPFLRMRHPQVEQIAVRRIARGLLERRSEMRRTEADVIGQPSTPKIM